MSDFMFRVLGVKVQAKAKGDNTWDIVGTLDPTSPSGIAPVQGFEFMTLPLDQADSLPDDQITFYLDWLTAASLIPEVIVAMPRSHAIRQKAIARVLAKAVIKLETTSGVRSSSTHSLVSRLCRDPYKLETTSGVRSSSTHSLVSRLCRDPYKLETTSGVRSSSTHSLVSRLCRDPYKLET